MEPDTRRENQWAHWNSTQLSANMEGSYRSERIRMTLKWEIRSKVRTMRKSDFEMPDDLTPRRPKSKVHRSRGRPLAQPLLAFFWPG